MIPDDLKSSILRSINTSGSASEEERKVNPIISPDGKKLLNYSSGTPKLRKSVIPNFALIFTQPLSLSAVHNTEIRCCLCRKVINYPAWHWRESFLVNQFYYFICFDSTSPKEVSARCYKVR